ncbi:hypothetical protein NEMBOFW57_008230 [Staphylotrichum longicolle]|uniref:Heterokaryon incompatibility domain-containing protein n=1 Tax=Staphylotrichum longicolle TaxID=669026 RepID=A0AAD4HTZ6_9PEZI|nr:hypothetical protein NEMBOFW57_008230 [Staphylotrichum longicolle]
MSRHHEWWKLVLLRARQCFWRESDQIYEALDTNNRSIRVLELSAGGWDSDISAKLTQVSLDAAPEYEALSYTWGNPKDRRSITVNGRRIKVTAHLDAALRHLRFEDRPRTLWVDALCINQTDLDERERQVRLMRQIYSSARKVLAWLGEASSDSDLAIELLQKKQYAKILEKGSAESVAFEKLCSRPYWTRMWILQELAANPKQCAIGCGTRWVEFDDVHTAFRSLRVQYKGSDHAHKAVMLSVYARSRLLNLFDLWQSTVLFAASDDRDKIYALLSLMKDTDNSAIAPDYGITVEELQRRFTEHMVTTQNSLRVIEGNRLPEERQAQSWLPLLHRHVMGTQERDPHGNFTFGGDVRISADGGFWKMETNFYHDRKVLGVKGVVIDVVKYATPRFRSDNDLLQPCREPGTSSLTVAQSSFLRAAETACIDTPGITKDHDFDPKHGLLRCLFCDFQNEISPFETARNPAGSKMLHLFDVLVGEVEVPPEFEPETPPRKRVELYCKPLLQKLFEANQDRCFFITAKGYMGLGPADVQNGDSLCILYGSGKPFILRRAQRGQWRLQGDGFVYGIMKGQLFHNTWKDRSGKYRDVLRLPDVEFKLC